MAVKELPQGIDPDLVRSMITRAHDNYHIIEKQWDSLLEAHEGEWVAAHNGEIVFGKTIEQVLGEAVALGWPLSTIAIDQLLRERANVLL